MISRSGLLAAAFSALIAAASPAAGQKFERMACIIHVDATINFYGPLATPEKAAELQHAMETCWNGHQLGCCKIVFGITANAYPDVSSFLGTPSGGFPVYLKPGPGRSWVLPHVFGHWNADNPWASCHELGHILGLWDDYSYLSGDADAGHVGHMMATQKGRVDQHEIDDMMKAHQISCPNGCCPGTDHSTSAADLDAEEQMVSGH